MSKKISFSLNFKVIIVISSIIILTAVILSCFFIAGQALILKGSIENRAIILANSLASSSEYGVATNSKEFLSLLTKNTLKEEDVLYSIVYGTNGNPLAIETVADDNVEKYIFSSPLESEEIKTLEKEKLKKHTGKIKNMGEFIDIVVPISSFEYIPAASMSIISTKIGAPISSYKEDAIPVNIKYDEETVIGAVRIGITLDRINYQIEKMTKSIVFLTLIVILAGIIISFFLVKIILTPIKELMLGTQKISSGDLEYRVSINSKDEFKELANSFNSMAQDMETHIRELNLEKRELMRLKIAFEQRSNELEETLKKVQIIQQDLVRAEKFATIGRLASSVAHELRNPLAAIKNISYFLSRMHNFDDDKSKMMVKMLSDEVLRANKIITELLDYSRIKKLTKLAIEIIPFINKVLPEIPMPENVKIVTELEDFTVMLDPDKITQVLINLITNARDAMPADKRDGLIKVTARTEGNVCQIFVEDNACGMSEETLSHLFEPLFTTKLKGIGLGLPIAKEIIDAHQGKITATSIKDVGTTFRIELPLQ